MIHTDGKRTIANAPFPGQLDLVEECAALDAAKKASARKQFAARKLADDRQLATSA